MEVEIKEKVNLGIQIKINRIRQGYSLMELSRVSGIPYETIRLIEVGKTKLVPLNKIIIISQSLGVSLEEIIVERTAMAWGIVI